MQINLDTTEVTEAITQYLVNRLPREAIQDIQFLNSTGNNVQGLNVEVETTPAEGGKK